MLFTHETRGNVECKDHHHMYRESSYCSWASYMHVCKVESSGLMSVATLFQGI